MFVSGSYTEQFFPHFRSKFECLGAALNSLHPYSRSYATGSIRNEITDMT